MGEALGQVSKRVLCKALGTDPLQEIRRKGSFGPGPRSQLNSEGDRPPEILSYWRLHGSRSGYNMAKAVFLGKTLKAMIEPGKN